MTQIPRRTGRALAVALIGAAGWAGALAVFIAIARSSWALSSPLIAADPADVLLLIVAVLGALVTAWLGLATVASALGELPGTFGWLCSRLSDRIAPAVLRRIVTVAIGTALVAGASPAIAAAQQESSATRHTGVTVITQAPDPAFRPLPDPAALATHPPLGVATPDPGFVPIAPSAPAPTPTEIGALAHAPRHLPAAGEPHVVRRGDTLWDIAAARLGPGATPAQIAAAWPRWYAVNRHVIGPDPAVIVPGQRLVPPAASDNRSAATPARVAQGSTR